MAVKTLPSESNTDLGTTNALPSESRIVSETVNALPSESSTVKVLACKGSVIGLETGECTGLPTGLLTGTALA